MKFLHSSTHGYSLCMLLRLLVLGLILACQSPVTLASPILKNDTYYQSDKFDKSSNQYETSSTSVNSNSSSNPANRVEVEIALFKGTNFTIRISVKDGITQQYTYYDTRSADDLLKLNLPLNSIIFVSKNGETKPWKQFNVSSSGFGRINFWGDVNTPRFSVEGDALSKAGKDQAYNASRLAPALKELRYPAPVRSTFSYPGYANIEIEFKAGTAFTAWITVRDGITGIVTNYGNRHVGDKSTFTLPVNTKINVGVRGFPHKHCRYFTVIKPEHGRLAFWGAANHSQYVLSGTALRFDRKDTAKKKPCVAP